MLASGWNIASRRGSQHGERKENGLWLILISDRGHSNAVMSNSDIIEFTALDRTTRDAEVRYRWCAQTRCRTGRRAPPARESRSARTAVPVAGVVRLAGLV